MLFRTLKNREIELSDASIIAAMTDAGIITASVPPKKELPPHKTTWSVRTNETSLLPELRVECTHGASDLIIGGVKNFIFRHCGIAEKVPADVVSEFYEGAKITDADGALISQE